MRGASGMRGVRWSVPGVTSGDSDAGESASSMLLELPDTRMKATDVLLGHLITSGLGLVMSWLAARIMRRIFMPAAKPDAAQNSVIKRLIHGGVRQEKLSGMNAAELSISCELVFPEEVSTRFRDIGGLDSLKKEVRDVVVLPLRAPSLFAQHELLRPTKGVMLYGPPGTGKTMLVRALAKESGARFLNLSPSSLLSKWLGETNRMVRAVFTLATRVAPCVIFVDEMDALFRARSAGDHEIYRDMKAEFCQLWDGLLTDSSSQVMLIGATNRPWDIDSAILRRMPRSFLVDLPNFAQRVDILRAILRTSVLDRSFDFDQIGELTEGYSGSDLSEVCRTAFQAPMRDALDQIYESDTILEHRSPEMRPLRTADVLRALEVVVPTIRQSNQYRDIASKRDAARAGAPAAPGVQDLVDTLSTSMYRDPFSDGYHEASM